MQTPSSTTETAPLTALTLRLRLRLRPSAAAEAQGQPFTEERLVAHLVALDRVAQDMAGEVAAWGIDDGDGDDVRAAHADVRIIVPADNVEAAERQVRRLVDSVAPWMIAEVTTRRVRLA